MMAQHNEDEQKFAPVCSMCGKPEHPATFCWEKPLRSKGLLGAPITLHGPVPDDFEMEIPTLADPIGGVEKIECSRCFKDVGKPHIARHLKACKGLKWVLQGKEYICPICFELTDKTHKARHEASCDGSQRRGRGEKVVSRVALLTPAPEWTPEKLQSRLGRVCGDVEIIGRQGQHAVVRCDCCEATMRQDHLDAHQHTPECMKVGHAIVDAWLASPECVWD
jgi:hypothetical protein